MIRGSMSSRNYKYSADFCDSTFEVILKAYSKELFKKKKNFFKGSHDIFW